MYVGSCRDDYSSQRRPNGIEDRVARETKRRAKKKENRYRAAGAVNLLNIYRDRCAHGYARISIKKFMNHGAVDLPLQFERGNVRRI